MIVMLDSGRMEDLMVLVYFYGLMEIDIKDISKKDWKMVKAMRNMALEIFIKVPLSMVKSKDMENISGKMVLFTRELSEMAWEKAAEYGNHRKVTLIKVNIRMVRNKGMEYIHGQQV